MFDIERMSWAWRDPRQVVHGVYACIRDSHIRRVQQITYIMDCELRFFVEDAPKGRCIIGPITCLRCVAISKGD